MKVRITKCACKKLCPSLLWGVGTHELPHKSVSLRSPHFKKPHLGTAIFLSWVWEPSPLGCRWNSQILFKCCRLSLSALGMTSSTTLPLVTCKVLASGLRQTWYFELLHWEKKAARWRNGNTGDNVNTEWGVLELILDMWLDFECIAMWWDI